MNKKRGLIALFSMLIVCVLAIGYAAITATVTLTGTTTATKGDFALIWDNTVVSGTATPASGTTNAALGGTVSYSVDDKTATFTATGFKVPGDKVVFTLTVKNVSNDYNATGVAITKTSVDGTEHALWTEAHEISSTTINAKTGTATVTFTFTLKTANANEDDASATWTFTVTGDAQAVVGA